MKLKASPSGIPVVCKRHARSNVAPARRSDSARRPPACAGDRRKTLGVAEAKATATPRVSGTCPCSAIRFTLALMEFLCCALRRLYLQVENQRNTLTPGGELTRPRVQIGNWSQRFHFALAVPPGPPPGEPNSSETRKKDESKRGKSLFALSRCSRLWLMHRLHARNGFSKRSMMAFAC